MTTNCERCGTPVPPHDSVQYGDLSHSETLCMVCFI
jgi:hypothetical protein